jgi:hydrogenase maturation protease
VIGALRAGAFGDVTLVESAGDDLLEWLAQENLERVLIVDAAELGRPAGTWARLTAEQVMAAPELDHVHGFGLCESLRLLRALGLRPAPITIYAVQPAAVGWRPGLSREARRGAAAVAAAIRRELRLPPPPVEEGQCSGQSRKSVACPAVARRRTSGREGDPWPRSW